jgi:hypothetical protein
MELGKRISEQSTGMQALLYSDFPFSWRKDGGPRDEFEREAIRQLRLFPDQPFYRARAHQISLQRSAIEQQHCPIRCHSPAGLGLRRDTRFERPGHLHEVSDRDSVQDRQHRSQ